MWSWQDIPLGKTSLRILRHLVARVGLTQSMGIEGSLYISVNLCYWFSAVEDGCYRELPCEVRLDYSAIYQFKNSLGF